MPSHCKSSSSPHFLHEHVCSSWKSHDPPSHLWTSLQWYVDKLRIWVAYSSGALLCCRIIKCLMRAPLIKLPDKQPHPDLCLLHLHLTVCMEGNLSLYFFFCSSLNSFFLAAYFKLFVNVLPTCPPTLVDFCSGMMFIHSLCRCGVTILPHCVYLATLLFCLLVALLSQNSFHRFCSALIWIFFYDVIIAMHAFMAIPKESSSEVVLYNKRSILTEVPPGMPNTI